MGRQAVKKPRQAKAKPTKARKPNRRSDPDVRKSDPFRELGSRGRSRRITALSSFFDGSRSRSRTSGFGLFPSTGGERSMESLPTSSGSGNADIAWDLPELWAQSQALYRRCALAHGAIELMVNSSVGTGITMQSRLPAEFLGLTKDQARETQQTLERLWTAWAGSTRADAEGRHNFYGLQRLMLRSVKVKGDAFSAHKMRPARDWPFDLAVQLFEADQVMSPIGHPEGYLIGGSGNRLTHGVEQGPNGEVIAYHLADQHPGNILSTIQIPKRIPVRGGTSGAKQLFHHAEPDRIGQARSVPCLSVVAEKFYQADEYTRAVLTAANVGACFSGFINTPDGGGLGLEESTDADNSNPQDYRLGPGALLDLKPGETITFADPKQPQQTFGEFILSVCRQIGAALGLPLEVMLMHFESSYTAARGATLLADRRHKRDSDFVVESFCQPTYEAFVTEQVAKGRIVAPGYFDDPLVRMAYCSAVWTPPSRGQIDPYREAQAAELRMKLKLTTHQEECAAISGNDFDETLDRLAIEADMIREAGLDAEEAAERIRVDQPPNGLGLAPPKGPDGKDLRDTDPDAADAAEKAEAGE